MKHGNRARLVGLSFIAALAACADSTDLVTAPSTAMPDVRGEVSAASAAQERATLSRIGRLVAISLDDRPMRHRLKKDLRAAPFREHKLELRTYLRSDDGRQLLRRMAAAGGRSTDGVLTMVDQVRSLELYMPVRKHRESWVGDGDVLVAVQLEEDDPIVGFNTAGKESEVDPTSAPAQPTLSIVSAETRFDQPNQPGMENVGDLNGAAIGTRVPAGFQSLMEQPCQDCPGDGGPASPPPPSIQPGLYLEFSRILDVHEPWNRGDPEIEVHIQGPSDQGNPRTGDDLSCSGEHSYDYRKVFNQDNGFWNGRVMLFSADEVSRFESRFADGYHVMFWEDDDTACVLKLDNQVLIELLKATASAGSVALKVIPIQWRLVASAFLAAFFTNPGEWLRTNDDFVGVAAPKENFGYNYPENTHVIMEGRNLNGRATIVYHQ